VTEDEHPIDSMTLDDARVVWLTMLGSDWVDEDVLINEPYGSVLDVAGMVLEQEGLLEYDSYKYKIKLRCKS
jgi:hypothetical protein